VEELVGGTAAGGLLEKYGRAQLVEAVRVAVEEERAAIMRARRRARAIP